MTIRIIISKLFVMISCTALYNIHFFLFFLEGREFQIKIFLKIIIYFFTNYSCHQICGTPDQQVIKEYCIGLKT